jgi:TPR repeat protein
VKYLLRLLVALLAMMLVLGACSDYDEARRAYERGDYPEALRRFGKLASEGEGRAQFDLAHMYFSGVGVPIDQASGWRYLQAAAQSGQTGAMVELGMRYAAGMGTQQNLIMAAQWYRRAARLGDPMAAFNLASMHEAGTEVAKDPLLAYAWYVIAFRNGNSAARARADELRSKMVREDVERAEALMKKLVAEQPS